MKEIADFYIDTILKSAEFKSASPVNDMSLLFPDFKAVFENCVAQYKNKYPGHDVVFAETYRSNILQEKYYNNGASKIKKDGMHHFGIAGDSIFIINGKQTYKGDVNLLRKIYKDNGLTILGMWDPLHVQYIPVARQQELRNMVKNATAGIGKVHTTPEMLVAGADPTAVAAQSGGEYTDVAPEVAAIVPYGPCDTYGEERCYNGRKFICDRLFGTLKWAELLNERC